MLKLWICLYNCCSASLFWYKTNISNLTWLKRHFLHPPYLCLPLCGKESRIQPCAKRTLVFALNFWEVISKPLVCCDLLKHLCLWTLGPYILTVWVSVGAGHKSRTNDVICGSWNIVLLPERLGAEIGHLGNPSCLHNGTPKKTLNMKPPVSCSGWQHFVGPDSTGGDTW